MKCLSRLLDRFIDWLVPDIPRAFTPLSYADVLADLEAGIDSHEPNPPSDDTVWRHLEQWAGEQQAADDITALVAATLRSHTPYADRYAELVADVLTDHYDFTQTGDHDGTSHD